MNGRFAAIGAMLVAGLIAGPALATVDPTTWMASIIPIESSGNPYARTGSHLGLLQVGPELAADIGWLAPGCKSWSCGFSDKAASYGVTSVETFLGNANAQMAMGQDVIKEETRLMRYYRLDQYIGQDFGYGAFTEGDILAAIHLGGIGTSRNYFAAGGDMAWSDKLGTTIPGYITKFRNAGGQNTGGSTVVVAYRPPYKSPACADPVRQRMAAGAAKAAQNALKTAATVFKPPPPALQTCVGNLVQALNAFKMLSGVAVDPEKLLQAAFSAIGGKVCAVLADEINKAIGAGFDPVAFLTAQLPPGTSAFLPSTGVSTTGVGTWIKQ